MRTYEQRIWREFRAGNLSRTERDVMLTLRTFSAPRFPSHQTLADRAGCCVRTVQRALAAARELGLVEWAERRVRAGWRWLRTSNVYRLLVPDAPAVTTGLRGRGGDSQLKKMAPQAVDNRRLRPCAPVRTVAEQIAAMLG
jgi:DNA-binding transcriptional MocR family regulator